MTDPVFFAPSRRISVSEIAELTGARLVDESHGDVLVTGIASASEGGEGQLVFVEGKRNAALLDGLTAAAVLCTDEFAALVPPAIAALVTPKPQWAFALIGRLLYPTAARPQPLTGETGISPRSVVSQKASLEAGVIVEAGAVIGPDVAIGSGTIIAANAVIGASSQIGRDCYVGPAATVQCALIGNRVVIHGGAQIGKEGFGFVAGPRSAERLPHIGRVVIQDDVEIGANTTVDRGALADTDHRRGHQDRQSRPDRPQCQYRPWLHDRRQCRPVGLRDPRRRRSARRRRWNSRSSDARPRRPACRGVRPDA